MTFNKNRTWKYTWHGAVLQRQVRHSVKDPQPDAYNTILNLYSTEEKVTGQKRMYTFVITVRLRLIQWR